MPMFTVQAITPVADYMGLCELIINDFCITITTNGSIVNEILARVLGTWCFKHIRNFRLIKSARMFSFTSGRRGPYGVQEYLFKVLKDWSELSAIITRLLTKKQVPTGSDKVSLTDVAGQSDPSAKFSYDQPLEQQTPAAVAAAQHTGGGANPPDSDYGSAWDFSQLRSQVDSEQALLSDQALSCETLLVPSQIYYLPVPRQVKIDTTVPLQDQRWYYGSMTRHTAESILSRHRDGSFLVRNTCSEIHDGYTFSVVSHSEVPSYLHTTFVQEPEGYKIMGIHGQGFHQSVSECIVHCTRSELLVEGRTYRPRYPVLRK